MKTYYLVFIMTPVKLHLLLLFLCSVHHSITVVKAEYNEVVFAGKFADKFKIAPAKGGNVI